MPDFRFTFDPAKVKISDGEILADLTYPVRPATALRAHQQRPAHRRATRR